MNIASQESVTIKIEKEEVRQVLLDYIKRMAGGVVDNDMELAEDPFGHVEPVAFTWNRVRSKEVK